MSRPFAEATLRYSNERGERDVGVIVREVVDFVLSNKVKNQHPGMLATSDSSARDYTASWRLIAAKTG